MLPGGVARLPELASTLVPAIFVANSLLEGYAIVEGEAFLHLIADVSLISLFQIGLIYVREERL